MAPQVEIPGSHPGLAGCGRIATRHAARGRGHGFAPRLASEDTFTEVILDYANTILIDTFVNDQFGGTGKVGDWTRFNALKERYPQTNWVLAGGLSPSNLLDALASATADHLDINSGVEIAPGIKDGEKLREAFKILR